MLFRRANLGDNRLLPGDWTVELHEKDHAHETERATEAYESLRDRVLFVATSFGAEPTLALRDALEEDGVVAFPSSLSSKMADHTYTPPVGATYRRQGMRAAAFAADETDALGVVHRDDSFGRDALEGARAAVGADRVVARTGGSFGSDAAADLIDALQSEGVESVLLADLPGTTASLLEAAAQEDYEPTWIATTPAWSDRFYTDDSPVPAERLTGLHRVTSFPYWGEDVPGMEEFVETYEEYGSNEFRPDHYMLQSYIHGLVQLEILRRCIDDGALTRADFLEQLRTVSNFTAGGLTPEIDLSETPYPTIREARILRAAPDDRGWNVASEYRAPNEE